VLLGVVVLLCAVCNMQCGASQAYAMSRGQEVRGAATATYVELLSGGQALAAVLPLADELVARRVGDGSRRGCILLGGRAHGLLLGGRGRGGRRLLLLLLAAHGAWQQTRDLTM
jgi:hypothetical protein